MNGSVKQVAAIPYRTTVTGEHEVLLVTSRHTRRWIVPKGWPWPKRPDCEAAAGEAFEEAGVSGTIEPEPSGRYVYAKQTRRATLEVVVDVYLLEVTLVLEEWPERCERERVWLTPAEAMQRIGEPALAGLIEKIAEHHANRHPQPIAG